MQLPSYIRHKFFPLYSNVLWLVLLTIVNSKKRYVCSVLIMFPAWFSCTSVIQTLTHASFLDLSIHCCMLFVAAGMADFYKWVCKNIARAQKRHCLPAVQRESCCEWIIWQHNQVRYSMLQAMVAKRERVVSHFTCLPQDMGCWMWSMSSTTGRSRRIG